MAGRPSKYKKEYCQMLIDHMKQGYSFESFGAEIPCSKETLYRWEKAHKPFSDAKKTATALCLKWWEGVGMRGMHGLPIEIKDPLTGRKVTGKNFNAAIWIFNMKNRFMWRDRQEITDSTDGVFTFTKKKGK